MLPIVRFLSGSKADGIVLTRKDDNQPSNFLTLCEKLTITEALAKDATPTSTG